MAAPCLSSALRPQHSVMQVTKYVEREIVNHRQLMHPHIVQFKEVCTAHIVDGLSNLLALHG